jgi:hypothetical protein
MVRDERRQRCPCHEHSYVFRGHGPANGAARHVGAKLVDVARRAEVSPATVSNVLNRPDMVAERTRIRVETAIAELGYVRAGQTGETAAHWRKFFPVLRQSTSISFTGSTSTGMSRGGSYGFFGGSCG